MDIKQEESSSISKKADFEHSNNVFNINSRSTATNLLTPNPERIISSTANSMDIEQALKLQAAQAIHTSEVSFWQTQKLPAYKEEMKEFLLKGLSMYDVKPLPIERVTELLDKAESDPKSENNNDIFIRILAQKIENSRESQVELARKCKAYIDSLTKAFEDLDEVFYMNFVCSYASFKSYLETKINYIDKFVVDTHEYEVWEIKNTDFLKEIVSSDNINLVKNQRRLKTKAINALDKLIKNIQKLKPSDDLTKIFTLKDKYEEIIHNTHKKPEFIDKTPKNAKRKHGALEESTCIENKETEAIAIGSVKKVKLSASKETTVRNEKESAGKSNGHKHNEGKSSLKKDQKDQNQINILNFFKKKPVEEPKPDIRINEVAQGSRFKCLGFLENKSIWNSDRAEAFEKVLRQNEEKKSIKELLELAKKECVIKPKEIYSKRKIFIYIHDSSKMIKGKYERDSCYVKGTHPLAKDKELDYEVDSEDEIQEQNAEDISQEHPSDMDEPDLEDDDEDHFVVPDGYISQDEKLDSSEDGNDERDRIEDRENLLSSQDLETEDRPKPIYFSMADGYQVGKDVKLDEYLANFQVIKLVEEVYPLNPKKAKETFSATGKVKLNPEAINDDELIKELLLTLHGNFSKQDTINKINAKFPNCSKNAIERKINELEHNQLIKKSKMPGEPRGNEEEYRKTLKKKIDEELERQRLEKEKRENEKRMKQGLPSQHVETTSGGKKISKDNKEDPSERLTGVRKTVQTSLSFFQIKSPASESNHSNSVNLSHQNAMENLEVIKIEASDGETYSNQDLLKKVVPNYQENTGEIN